MTTVEALEQDHAALRRELADVEHVLTVPGTPDAAQATCRRLLKDLERHLRREEDVLAPYAGQVAGLLRSRALRDYAPPRVVLGDLGTLFKVLRIVPTGLLVTHLCRLLEELRESMADEEQGVFPVVKHQEEAATVAP